MRLQVSERPKWRKVGKPSQVCVAVQHLCRRVAEDEVYIAPRRCNRRAHHTHLSGEIESSKRQTNKYAPSLRADQPWNGHTGTGRAQLRRTLSIAHSIFGTSPIPS